MVVGSPSNYFLGNPVAKRTSVLPARVFDAAAGNSGFLPIALATALRLLLLGITSRQRSDRLACCLQLSAACCCLSGRRHYDFNMIL